MNEAEPLPDNTPEPGADSQAADVMAIHHANLVKKVKAGKSLTAAEVAILKGVADGCEIGADGWVRTQVELAEVLGVERKTVQRWLKEDGNPGARPNGRYHVAEWKEWADTNGKKLGDTLPSQTQLKARQLLLQNERLELELNIRKGLFVPISDVERDVGDMVMQAKRVLLALPSSLAPQVVGLTVPEAEKVLKASVLEALEQLHSDPLGTANATNPD